MTTISLPVYVLQRVYLKDRVVGSIFGPDAQPICKTLELPWRDNKRGVSCIKEGIYKVIVQPPKESRPYSYFRLPEVEGRTGILIHRGNQPAHSKGCILVGSRFGNYDSAEPTLEESGKKLKYMVDTLPPAFLLRVESKSGQAYLNA